MTNEEKQLLIKDLSARLLYGVKVKVTLPWANDVEFASDIKIRTLNTCLLDVVLDNDNQGVKPYLRSMKSMTDKKKEVYEYLCSTDEEYRQPFDSYRLVDWLNAHHFDYRGLIEKGLALEAQEGMYSIK